MAWKIGTQDLGPKSEQSKELQESFDEILTSMSLEQRREFIRVFNEILRASDVKTLTDVDKSKVKIFQKYLALKTPDRKIVYNFLKKFFSVKSIRTAFWSGLKENKKNVEKDMGKKTK